MTLYLPSQQMIVRDALFQRQIIIEQLGLIDWLFAHHDQNPFRRVSTVISVSEDTPLNKKGPLIWATTRQDVTPYPSLLVSDPKIES